MKSEPAKGRDHVKSRQCTTAQFKFFNSLVVEHCWQPYRRLRLHGGARALVTVVWPGMLFPNSGDQ